MQTEQVETETEHRNNEQELTERDIAGKYLTITLGSEGYGLAILKVQEIIGVQKITSVPRSPQYLKGVINLRGKIIPIVDLRLKIGLEEKSYDSKTCFIVVNACIYGEDLSVGLVVDTVREVVSYTESQIDLTPQYGINLDSGYILGVGKIADSVDILINVDRVLETTNEAMKEIL